MLIQGAAGSMMTLVGDFAKSGPGIGECYVNCQVCIICKSQLSSVWGAVTS